MMWGHAGDDTLSHAQDELRTSLEQTAREVTKEMELPVPRVQGKLLRPAVAWAAAPAQLRQSREFRFGALAIQMVHEASLLHDDILDGSDTRRGAPSLAAERGLAAALVQGDHLLTAAYRVACATGSLPFLGCFTQAVERTVAGEKAQGAAVGRILSEGEYREVVSAKSGELFGCAVALGSALSEGQDWSGAYRLGTRLGRIYQMVDDYLDLCPGAPLGKPPFQDIQQKKWTWPLAELGMDGFDSLPEDPAHALFQALPGDESPMRRAFHRLTLEVEELQSLWRERFPHDRIVIQLLQGWSTTVGNTLDEEERRIEPSSIHSPSPDQRAREAAAATVRFQAGKLGQEGDWARYFARNSRSFSFAARLFPEPEARLVSGVYAFCRFTDDLVDDAPGVAVPELRRRLDAWAAMVREAHRLERTGVPLLDEVMGETRGRGVSSLYAQELIRGVAMDLEPREFPDLAALQLYSYRVASVVGLWLTELFGTHDPWVLRRAEAMGHAMQLTNILRDVGEDLRRGRLYLPLDHLTRHGITRSQLEDAVHGGADVPTTYPALMEELMGVAEKEYEAAAAAIPALPSFFQRPVAVAGRVYRGIHREIRRNDYDNLGRRAVTSLPRKVLLGGRGLFELRGARRRLEGKAEASLPRVHGPNPFLVQPAGRDEPDQPHNSAV